VKPRCPRTRKEFVTWLWAKGRTDCNLIKEGPFYTAMVGSCMRATHERCIDWLTFEQWEQYHFQPVATGHLKA